MDFEVKTLLPGLYTLEQRGVRAFLVVGPDRAVLVDTCFGGEILAACRTVTALPITLITTHSDFDHIGGHGQFPAHYIHPQETERYLRKGGAPIQALPMEEGTVFQVGDYTLEAVLLPGHTPGSVALLERYHGFLLSGDAVQQHNIFMHGDGRQLRPFRDSIRKLDALRQAGVFHTIHPSHGPVNVPADILLDHLALCDALLAGTAEPFSDAPDRFPKTVKTYCYGRTGMYMDPADI